MNKTVIKDYSGCNPICIGGFGELCNNNTQFHNQNRIYKSDGVSTTITTCCLPYFLVEIDGKSKSNRKIES